MMTRRPSLRSLSNSLIAAPSALSIALGTSLLTATLALASPASANEGSNDGSKARVNLSARLRSLTEDVAASACRVHSGVAADDARDKLQAVKTTYETILKGLVESDPRLGIPTVETNNSVIRALRGVKEIWEPIAEASDRIISGGGSAADIELIASTHRELLDRTETLTAVVSGVYSDPIDLLQRDAITLNFLGRQRSLATRFARTSCGIYAGSEDIGTRDEMVEAIQTFEQSFTALINGFPAAGVSPPPSELVKAVLSDSKSRWDGMRASLLAKMEDGAAIQDAAAEFAQVGDSFVAEINNAITLYLLASPGKEDVFSSVLAAYAEDQLMPWLQNTDLVQAVKAQNAENETLSQEEIDALDQTWRAEVKSGGGELLEATLAKPLSRWLYDMQVGTAGLVTEVFVMDNRGLNVGQSAVTSDYWQGDEDKWQQTFGLDTEQMHVGELEFDDSSGLYQTQASQIIVDPDTGERIGAITFGINVISLM